MGRSLKGPNKYRKDVPSVQSKTRRRVHRLAFQRDIEEKKITLGEKEKKKSSQNIFYIEILQVR